MSYPGQESMPVAPPRRPAAVTCAAVLLIVMAVVGLAHALTGLAALGGTVARFRAATVDTAASRSDIDAAVALLRGGAIVAVIVALLMAALLAVLAQGLLRGRMLVTTWVVCAFGLLCGCGALTAVIVQRAVPLSFSADERAAAELVRGAADAYPSWWAGLGATLSVAQGLSYLAVAVLLALPRSGEFFHRRPPAPAGPPAAPGPAGPATYGWRPQSAVPGPPMSGPPQGYAPPPSGPPGYGPPPVPGSPGYGPPPGHGAPPVPGPPGYGPPPASVQPVSGPPSPPPVPPTSPMEEHL